MSRTDPGRLLIIGAGPTGLGAAYRLQELGFDDFLVLEAGDTPGGLAQSYLDAQGFTWDMGGHVQFSHYSYYDRVLDEAIGDGWLWHERESWVWIKGRFVPYPFQNNIHRLDPEDRDNALAGLERARLEPSASNARSNFGAWIAATFGDELGRIFMYPYNRKVWGYPLEELDAGWIGDRVALPDVDRIRRNISDGRDDPSWGPNRRFRFPESGGTGAIWRNVARLLDSGRIAFGQDVVKIDLRERVVTVKSGETHQFDALLSTLPLDILTRIAEPLPVEARRAGESLRYSSVHVLGVGLRGERPSALATKCWMYFPEDHSPYYRVTVFSNYSPLNVPEGDGHWSLMAEVCESPKKPVDATTLRETTLAAMRRDGLLAPGTQVVSFWHGRAHHGYPTPFLGRDRVLDQIMPALEAGRVFSRGRFGGWKYEVSNQDHSFMQGVEWADSLIRGEPETTFPDPHRANSGVFLLQPK